MKIVTYLTTVVRVIEHSSSLDQNELKKNKQEIYGIVENL